MKVCGEESIKINGEDYWTVDQFSRLTGKKEGTIRVLISKGNRIRKLRTVHIAMKPFILAAEIFEFPFVITGRPSEEGDYVEKFVQEGEDLTIREEMINDNKPITDPGV